MRRSKGAMNRAAKKAKFEGYYHLDTKSQAETLRRVLVDLPLERLTLLGADDDELDSARVKGEAVLHRSIHQMMRRLERTVAWSKYNSEGVTYGYIEAAP